MKVLNTGESTFILTDIRGNTVFLEKGQSARVTKKTAERIKKIPSYCLIQVIEEETDREKEFSEAVDKADDIVKEVEEKPKKRKKK